MNKYKTKILKNIVLIILSLLSINLTAQINDSLDYSSPKTYELAGIIIEGAENLNNSTLISITGLEIGKNIQIPGTKITKAITKLWEQGLFSNIEISIDKIVDNSVFLLVKLNENPRLSQFKFKGKKVSKSDVTALKEDLKLMRGKVLTQNLISNSTNKIKDYYINKGFYNVIVGHETSVDTEITNSEKLIFNITKGKKIKIKNIILSGRTKILNTKKTILNKQDSIYCVSNYKIKKSMKEINFKEVKKALINRNFNDSTRKISPLQKHPDAVIVNSGKLDKKAMVAKMSKYVEKFLKK